MVPGLLPLLPFPVQDGTDSAALCRLIGLGRDAQLVPDREDPGAALPG